MRVVRRFVGLQRLIELGEAALTTSAAASEVRAAAASGGESGADASAGAGAATAARLLSNPPMDLIWHTKPLLDGNALTAKVGVPKGPAIKMYLEHQFMWQLRNPNGSAEDCLQFLTQLKHDPTLLGNKL